MRLRISSAAAALSSLKAPAPQSAAHSRTRSISCATRSNINSASRATPVDPTANLHYTQATAARPNQPTPNPKKGRTMSRTTAPPTNRIELPDLLKGVGIKHELVPFSEGAAPKHRYFLGDAAVHRTEAVPLGKMLATTDATSVHNVNRRAAASYRRRVHYVHRRAAATGATSVHYVHHRAAATSSIRLGCRRCNIRSSVVAHTITPDQVQDGRAKAQ